MDERVLAVLRLTWPKSIPEHEYETAFLMASLIASAGRKPTPPPQAAPPEDTGNETVGVAEAAKLLGINAASIYGRLARGTLRSLPGKPIRIRRADLATRPATLQLVASESGMMSATEAGAILGITPGAVAYHANTGRLPHTKRDGKFSFAREAVEAMKIARGTKNKEGRRPRPAVNETVDPLSTAQVASILGIARDSVIALINAKKMKAQRQSGSTGRGAPWQVTRSDLAAYRAANEQAAS